jgi:hypothetical protein
MRAARRSTVAGRICGDMRTRTRDAFRGSELTGSRRHAAMAPPDLSAITALDNKASDLVVKGHYARAAEKRGEAVAAALGLGVADSLIVAYLRARQAGDFCCHKEAPGVSFMDGFTALQRANDLAAEATDTLQRRHDQGTLLPPRCYPAEVAWNAERLRHRMQMPNDVKTEFIVSMMAPFVGYEAYLHAAHVEKASFFVASGPGKEARIKQLLTFVASAAELMMAPRRDVPLETESELANALHSFEELLGSDAPQPAIARVIDAWQRLQRSGVLRERNIDCRSSDAADNQARIATRHARLAAAPKRSCALAACSALESHPAQFQTCGGCKAVVYCCREHQLVDWPSHKAACKAARKAESESNATE